MNLLPYEATIGKPSIESNDPRKNVSFRPQHATVRIWVRPPTPLPSVVELRKYNPLPHVDFGDHSLVGRSSASEHRMGVFNFQHGQYFLVWHCSKFLALSMVRGTGRASGLTIYYEIGENWWTWNKISFSVIQHSQVGYMRAYSLWVFSAGLRLVPGNILRPICTTSLRLGALINDFPTAVLDRKVGSYNNVPLTRCVVHRYNGVFH